ncbi:hypothetical protein DFQ28_009200 [Apophysomyces sp. BC1034]|nr:hypothetical protein DFQ30_008900 [Apophysomyces sp. BC1015]KAG0173603.1 hypothetical protein DFQ29_007891 [Apophysomyces sp. BC1021]KAG0185524.1 hypothetical protein DFQ28_009200 [Apophysomyces sp. BC1034]
MSFQEEQKATESNVDSDFSDVPNSQGSVDEDRVQHFAKMTIDQLSGTWELHCTRNRSTTNATPALKTTLTMATKLVSSTKRPVVSSSPSLSRALRQRRDIQLRPFTVENAQYRSLVGRRALDAMLAESEIPTQTTTGQYNDEGSTDDDTSYQTQPETQEIENASLESSLTSDIFDIMSTLKSKPDKSKKFKQQRPSLHITSTSTRPQNTTHNVTRVYSRKSKSKRPESRAVAASSSSQPHVTSVSALQTAAVFEPVDNSDEEPFLRANRIKKRKRNIVADSDEDGSDEFVKASAADRGSLSENVEDDVFELPEETNDNRGEIFKYRIPNSPPKRKSESLIEKLAVTASTSTAHQSIGEDAFVVSDDGFNQNEAAHKRVTLDELRKRKKALKGILPLSFSKVFSNQLQEEEHFREQQRKRPAESSRHDAAKVTRTLTARAEKTGPNEGTSRTESAETDVFSAFRGEESSGSSTEEEIQSSTDYIEPSTNYTQRTIRAMWDWDESKKSSRTQPNVQSPRKRPPQKRRGDQGRGRGRSKTVVPSFKRPREYQSHPRNQMTWDWSESEDDSPPARPQRQDLLHPRNQMIWDVDESEDEAPPVMQPTKDLSHIISPIVWHVDQSEEDAALHRRRLLAPIRFEMNQIKLGTQLQDGVYIQRGYLAQLLQHTSSLDMSPLISTKQRLFSSWILLDGVSADYRGAIECLFSQAFQYLANFWDGLLETSPEDGNIQTFYEFVSACLTQWIPSLPDDEQREAISLFRAEISRLCGRILVMSNMNNTDEQLNSPEIEVLSKWRSLVALLLYSLDWSCRLHRLDPVESGNRWSVENCAKQLMWLLLWIGPQKAQIHAGGDSITETYHPVVVESWVYLIHLLMSENQYVASKGDSMFWKMLRDYLLLEATAKVYPTVADKSEWLRHWIVVLQPLRQFDCHGRAGNPSVSWTSFGYPFDELRNMGDEDLFALAQQNKEQEIV